MRKYQKEQILCLINTIHEAHDNIRALLENKQFDEAVMLLTDCQEAAIRIGSSVEETEGDGIPLIHIIEDYCEILYQFSQELNSDNLDKYQFLKEQMLLIQTEIQSMEIKYEIVFLPYKAAQWDSLESIWTAANKDENCVCHVIPIPYFDRKADKSFGNMHYEGDRFPDYVPIVDYKEIDLKKMRPEVIYFHNPYDQFNLVTSVHPAFYSTELKKYTDMLIYVPYFITGGDWPETMTELPVYYHINKIVLQHESLKRYLPCIPEDKFIPMGSPKVDRIIYVENNKPEIPKEWLDFLKKEEFHKKKVFLYNTSISGLLQGREKYLHKMKYFLSFFKERKDVILVWRPHPLLVSTISTQAPDLLQEYKSIESEYIAEKLGIYDNTPDVTVSVALADAYIGESSSSLVHLFGVAGKPLFLTDLETYRIPTDDEKASVHFLDCDCIEDEIWFVADVYNVLCKMNIASGKTEVIAKLPETVYGDRRLFCDVLKVNDRILMLPLVSDALYEYDITSRSFTKKYFPDPAPENFDRIIHYKNYIYMIPTYYHAIIRYDLETGDFKLYTDCINDLRKVTKNYDLPLFIWGSIVRGNKLLLGSSQANLVLELNMDTDVYQIYTVGKEGSNYRSMTFDGKDYWLIPYRSKSIVRWNYETGMTYEYDCYPEGFQRGEVPFKNILNCKDYLLAFPLFANMIVKINKETGEMSEFHMDLPYREGEHESEYYNTPAKYYFAKSINSKVIALSAYNDSLLILDPDSPGYKLIPCRLDTDFVKRNEIELIRNQFLKKNKGFPSGCPENLIFTIDKFINYVISGSHNYELVKEYYSDIMKNLDGTCGEKVHSYVRDAIRK